MNDLEWLSRTKLLLGEEKTNKLIQAHVLIIGLGGVGAYAAEQLCRAGIGKMTIIDADIFQASNRNRQLPAMISTEGKSKAKVVERRLFDINPEIKIVSVQSFIEESNIDEIFQDNFSYIVDAIDTLSPKKEIIKKALEKKIPIVSSMGAGGKQNPALVQIADISKSHSCKLAFMLRKRLHRIGIYKGFNVVFSPETVDKNTVIVTEDEKNKKSNVGTISYMPAIFGCFAASEVIRNLTIR